MRPRYSSFGERILLAQFLPASHSIGPACGPLSPRCCLSQEGLDAVSTHRCRWAADRSAFPPVIATIAPILFIARQWDCRCYGGLIRSPAATRGPARVTRRSMNGGLIPSPAATRGLPRGRGDRYSGRLRSGR